MPFQLLGQSTTYVTSTNEISGGAAAGLMTALLLPILAFAVVSMIGLWKVFEKAGHPGWAAIVPFYNTYIMLQIAGKPAWWLLLMFISPISIVVSILVGMEIAKKFGRSEAFGAVVCGLLGVGYIILGFGSAKFGGSSSSSSTPTNVAPPSPVS